MAMPPNFQRLASIVIASLLLAACGGTPSPTDSTPAADSSAEEPEESASAPAVADLDAVCDAASAEGEVIWWSATDEEVSIQIIERFNEEYPDVAVTQLRVQPTDAVQRLAAEAAVGRQPEADIVQGDLGYYREIFDRDLVSDVDWASFGVEADQLTDIDGISIPRVQRTVLGLGYNETLVSEDELPDTWEDLVDPQWDGKIVVDPEGFHLSRLALVWGEEEAIEWYENLVETTNPLPVQGQTASVTSVIAGEAWMSTSAYDDNVKNAQDEGAPIAIKYLDIVPSNDHYSMILEGAEHPNGAQCFIAWFASEAGEQALLEFENKGNATRPEGVPEDSVIISADSSETQRIVDEVSSEFSRLTNP